LPGSSLKSGRFSPAESGDKSATPRGHGIFISTDIPWLGPYHSEVQAKAPAGASSLGQAAAVHTVGTFLEEVFRSTSNRRTVEGYATAFRTIVSDSLGFSSDQKKFDSCHGGRVEWLNRVQGICPRRGHAGQNPKVETVLSGQSRIRTPRPFRKARISVNSLMRRARSLFSPKILRHLQLEIPSIIPSTESTSSRVKV
jgi:hypothetical protein